MRFFALDFFRLSYLSLIADHAKDWRSVGCADHSVPSEYQPLGL